MLKVAIIGASIAGHTVATAVREKNKDCAISLLTEEDYPLYDRRLLKDYLAARMKDSEIFLTSENFYAEHNISFLKQKQVLAINPEKKKIFIQDSFPLEYNFLVICSGTSFALPEIPGAKKTGVFRLSSFQDYQNFLSYLIGEPICIVGSDGNALEIAKALASRKKEVKLISPKGVESADLSEGIEFINSSVVEIIGESGAQAIRIKEGKIIGISALVFMDEPLANTGFLRNTSIEMDQGYISVYADMRTSLKYVYSSGSVCRIKDAPVMLKNWDDVILESRLLSDNLLQDMV